MGGCNLRCIFCRNFDIAHQRNGLHLTPEELGDWYAKLQEVGKVQTINIVTPEHVVPQVALSILHARDRGSGFDSLASLELTDGLADIYLADFKVWESSTSKRMLKADDYAATARESIRAMQAQVGDFCLTGDGIAKRGVLVRYLVMSGKEAEGPDIMRFLASELSTDYFVDVMEQYRPGAHVGNEKRGRSSGRPDDEAGTPTSTAMLAERKSLDPQGCRGGIWSFKEPPQHDGFAI
ncbi:hypothetical protein TCAP_01153 [Tolypocladium capitatum]|uniref:Radical SAM core domain-containing protein n=1 Tax=Tolypocladium capitatum TaxID=45235 RepID=A0A2K3QN10_9HYPO|nr:hypothetical protein TCAP_01153 [Tolypocladium capitatum]